MSLTRVQAQAIIDKLKAHIVAISDPVFEYIIVGQPFSIPVGDRAAHLWYEGGSSDFQTLRDSSIKERFTMEFLWRPQQASELTERIEVEAWITHRAIKERLENDIKLTGSCEKVDLTEDDIVLGFIRISDVAVRSLRVSFRLWMYETNEITVQ